MKKHRHEGVYSIDYYAYLSKMKNWNPTFKVIFAFTVLILCILADNLYVSFFVFITMSMLTIFKGKVSLYDYIAFLKIPFAFMILGSIAIAIGISRKPIGDYNLNLYAFNLYSSYKDIIKTGQVMMKALGAISCMYMLTLSTSTSEIIFTLRKLKVPSIIIELMNMIYRFIFILLDIQYKMKASAKARLGYLDFKTSCYSFGSIASNLLIVAMKKANDYYNAMEARCYNGEMLFLEEEKKMSKKHIFYSIIYIVVLICIWIVF